MPKVLKSGKLTVRIEEEVLEIQGQDLANLADYAEAVEEGLPLLEGEDDKSGPAEIENIYPCIQRCKNTGLVVLFCSQQAGTVIASKNPTRTTPFARRGGPYQSVGNYYYYWKEPEYGFDFEPYFGPVTLQYAEDAKV